MRRSACTEIQGVAGDSRSPASHAPWQREGSFAPESSGSNSCRFSHRSCHRGTSMPDRSASPHPTLIRWRQLLKRFRVSSQISARPVLPSLSSSCTCARLAPAALSGGGTYLRNTSTLGQVRVEPLHAAMRLAFWSRAHRLVVHASCVALRPHAALRAEPLYGLAWRTLSYDLILVAAAIEPVRSRLERALQDVRSPRELLTPARYLHWNDRE
jgi:hypothetical protein